MEFSDSLSCLASHCLNEEIPLCETATRKIFLHPCQIGQQLQTQPPRPTIAINLPTLLNTPAAHGGQGSYSIVNTYRYDTSDDLLADRKALGKELAAGLQRGCNYPEAASKQCLKILTHDTSPYRGSKGHL